MDLFRALALALVQGLTEFLPVSSSGHLALAEAWLGIDEPGLFYEVLLHLATMAAVVVYFRRELWTLTRAWRRGAEGRPARRLLGLLVVTSVPTAAVGLTMEKLAVSAFGDPRLVAAGLFVTSIVLLSTLRLRRGASTDGTEELAADSWLEDLAAVRWRDAVVIGLAQGAAAWPGVSRSGSTIAAALWMGVPPLAAARFSLLASLPAIAGVFLLQLRELSSWPASAGTLLAGFALAFAIGLVAIAWLMAAVRGARLGWFALYTAALGLAALLASFGS